MDLLIHASELRGLKMELIKPESAKESVLTKNNEFPQELFQRPPKVAKENSLVRPSLSYWQDATRRFVKNKQSLFAFFLANSLIIFSFVGPFFWTKDPAQQDLNSASMTPNFGELAVVVSNELPTFEPSFVPAPVGESEAMATATATAPAPTVEAKDLEAVKNFKVKGIPTTQNVILTWDFVPGAVGYSIYRNEIKPEPGNYGIPLTDISQATQVSFEDVQSLEARDYFYTIVPKDANGNEAIASTELKVKVATAITEDAAKALGVKSPIGSKVRLSAAPLGTDTLGRDILARLMAGGKVSLFIGIFASVLSILFGIALGGVAGFFGGTIDSLLMRFTDLITGLPFLLCMILLKVVLNVGPGESGITALLISLVILSWTGSARLVRGQILQLRNSEFIQASRLMGARSGYLIVRHMLPNLVGVILVTLTFQIPSAIFTEAFLSFIGLGVAAPATSWGSMCNDAIQTLLTKPYEFFAPAVVISLTVLSFNLLGDGLRDALDPKLRSNE